MRIGIGNTIPERSNLPGQSGGGVVPLALSYSSSAFCSSASDPSPTVTGNVGAGTFSAGSGLQFLDTGSNTGSSTGVIDISASTPSATPYVITYTDTDSATATFNLTLNALDDAGFSYSESSYAQNFPDPTPTITGLTNGTFSGTTGLVIDSSTGVIDLDASTIASHTITYDTTSSGSSVCPNTSTQTINIVAELAQVSNVYSMEFDGSSDFIDIGTDVLFDSTNSFSVSTWINLDSYSTTFPTVLRINTDQSTDFIALALSNVTSYKGIFFGSTSSFVQARTTGDISGDFIGVWKHVCLTFDGVNRTALSSYKIYVNGSPVGLVNSGAFGNIVGNNNLIGFSQGASNYFNGKIDELAIFNVELTAQDVQSIYLATEIVSGVNKTADLNDLTTPPVKWYRMGD